MTASIPHQRTGGVPAPGLLGPALTPPPARPRGRVRYLVALPPGVAGRLAFDGLGSEPGGGWLDVSVRITNPGEWHPVRVRTAGGEQVDARVLDDGLTSTYELRDGAVLRRAEPVPGDGRPQVIDRYAVHVAGELYPVEALDLTEQRTSRRARQRAVEIVVHKGFPVAAGTPAQARR